MDVNTPTVVEQSTDHQPSRGLVTALQVNGWWVSGIDQGTALLTHPDLGTMHLQLDPADDDRVIPFIDGRQVSYRMATAHARGAE